MLTILHDDKLQQFKEDFNIDCVNVIIKLNKKMAIIYTNGIAAFTAKRDVVMPYLNS